MIMLPKGLHLFFILTIYRHCFAAGLRLGKCRKPEPPRNAVLSASGQLSVFGGKGVPTYHKIKFQCKVGYRAQGRMWSICGPNGKWLPKSKEAGKCVYDRRRSQSCGKGQFRCQGNGACISSALRCDCAFDCLDGSDEANCQNPRKFIVGGKANNKMSGAISSPGYPVKYPRNFKCTYSLITDDEYRFRVSFHEVDLRGRFGECDDFISMSGVHRPALSRVDEDSRMRKSTSKSSIVICGQDKPAAIISNSSSLDVTVNFDGGAQSQEILKQNKGFALIWTIVPRSSIPLPSYQNEPMPKGKIKGKLVSENYVTVVVPIAVSALVPLTLIVFICRKQASQRQHGQNTASQENVNDSLGKDLSSGGGDSEAMLYYELDDSGKSDVASLFVQKAESKSISRADIFYDRKCQPSFYDMKTNYVLRGPHLENTTSKCLDDGVSRYHSPEMYDKQLHRPHSVRRQVDCHGMPVRCNTDQNSTLNYYIRPCDIDRYPNAIGRSAGNDVRSFDIGVNGYECQYNVNNPREYRPAFWNQRISEKGFRGRTDMQYTEVYPCRPDCGCNRSKDITLQGSLPSERFVDGRTLVAKQQTSCQMTVSETETETTRSSLV